MTNAQSKFAIEGNYYKGINLDIATITTQHHTFKMSDVKYAIDRYIEQSSNEKLLIHGISCCEYCECVVRCKCEVRYINK